MNEDDKNKIDMDAMISEWKTSQQFVSRFTDDFPSLDNIVDGVPINQQPGTPYVGDTTLGGLAKSIPRSSLQQLPVFAAVVNGSKYNITAQLCSYFLRCRIFNENTFGKGLLSTMQIAAEQTINHGYAPLMCAAGQGFNDFGTTMRLLHYADVAPEPGIQDANESGYFYVTTNLTRSRVKKIRDKAKEADKSTWIVSALDKLLDIQPSTTNYSIYQSEARKKGLEQDSATYQFVTRYETGKGGKFVTFCPQLEEEPLRIVQSRSKFGYPRVNFLVIDPAPLTPFGMSRVRLASPNQNLMNAFYQNVAAMFIINSDPPIMQRGRFVHPPQLKRRSKWVSLDPNAKAELVEMSNSSLAQFVPIMKQMVAQIQNIMGVTIGTSSGDNNAMGFSKTAPGVKMQENFLNLGTNQVTHIMENFLRQYALVALDIYISEQSGKTTVILDDEAKNAINRIKPGAVGDDNKFDVTWMDLYDSIEEWAVEIVLSVGKDELDEKQRGDMQDMLTTLLQNAEALGPEAQGRIKEVLDMYMQKTLPEAAKTPAPTTPEALGPGATVQPGQPTNPQY